MEIKCTLESFFNGYINICTKELASSLINAPVTLDGNVIGVIKEIDIEKNEVIIFLFRRSFLEYQVNDKGELFGQSVALVFENNYRKGM